MTTWRVFISYVGGDFFFFFGFDSLYSWNVQSTCKMARKGVFFTEFHKERARGAWSKDGKAQSNCMFFQG